MAGGCRRAVGGLAVMLVLAGNLCAQSSGPGSATPGTGCACGAHPPGPPPDRTVEPVRRDAEGSGALREVCARHIFRTTCSPNVYSGAGRDVPDPTDVSEVRIGFLGPIEKQADQVFGLRMLHGAQLAIEEANARGGYGGKPFRLMVHDDYNNWQFGAEYGAERPTEPAIWGSAVGRSGEDDVRREGLGDLRFDQFGDRRTLFCGWRCGRRFPSSIRRRRIRRFRRPTFPGTSRIFRTTECSVTRWRGGFLRSWD